MMKKTVFAGIAFLTGLAMTVAACAPAEEAHTEHIDSDGDGKCDICGLTVGLPSVEEETYTITFMDDGEIVSTTEAKAGDFVDIPEVPAREDPRYSFVGWMGIDETDMAAGKVEVFESDMTFYTIWTERFGTENVYDSTRLKVDDEITVDGVKDAAYADTTPIEISAPVSGETQTKATMYVMWEDTYLYVFAEVTDASVTGYQQGAAIEDNDAFEIRIDLLHNESLAESGYTEGWGQPYRGEPGPMVEGQWKISAGSEFTVDHRFGDGSFAGIEWLSNESQNSGTTFGTSKKTDTGYTVEYQIDLSNANVPQEYRPHAGQEIGIGVRIFDKNAEGQRSVIALETLNNEMDKGPKKLSNFLLSANDTEEGTPVTVKAVRENFDVMADGSTDFLFQDTAGFSMGGNHIRTLWKGKNVYLLAELGEDTESLELTSSVLSQPVKFEADGDTRSFSATLTADEAFALRDTIDLTVSYSNGGEEETEKFILQIVENENDNARKVFYASALGEGETIAVDGVKDAAYDDAPTFEIATAQEGDAATNATGKAYVKWDDEALYVLVEVDDDTPSQNGSDNGENGDSVTLWLNLGAGRKFPNASTTWGNSNPDTSARPEIGTVNGTDGWQCEGQFRITRTGAMQKLHWLADDESKWTYKVESNAEGYVVEYRIEWATFADRTPDIAGAMIDLTINITDDKDGNSGREGFTMTNVNGIKAFEGNGVCWLDHLFLVNELFDEA